MNYLPNMNCRIWLDVAAVSRFFAKMAKIPVSLIRKYFSLQMLQNSDIIYKNQERKTGCLPVTGSCFMQ
jgi:hypothetical protein